MNKCIESHLLDEICTIKIKGKDLIGIITSINSNTFSVNNIGVSYGEFELKDDIVIKIQTIDNEIYLIETVCESTKKFENGITLNLKPIKQSHYKNKRQFKRLDIKSNFDEPFIIRIQQFPPAEINYWKKGTLIDISAGGIRVKEDNFLCMGQLIELELGIPFFDKNKYIVSRVVNKTKEDGVFIFSIQFLNISDEDKLNIEKYIDNVIN